MGWKDTLQTILLKRQAAQQPPMFSQPEDELDMPVSRGVPTNVFQPPQEQPQNPTPNSWQTVLRQQLPDDTPIDDSVDEPAVQPAPPVQPVADRWKNNRLVRNDGESDHDYMRRLGGSDAKGERNWKTVLKDAIAGAMRGGGTLPQVGGRQNYGAGAAGGALLGGIIGNVASGLINPDAPAQQWQQRQLGQLRQAEADDLKQRETEADINYKNTQAQQLPIANQNKANQAKVKQLQAAYSAAIRGGQGFDSVNNPQHKRLAEAMSAAGIPAIDLPPDIKDTRWVYDTNTQEDVLEYLNKDGTWRTARMGEKYKPQESANRDAAVIKQERDRAFAQEMEAIRQANRVALEGVRQGNRLDLKQTPGAKATGGSIAEGGANGSITESQLRAKVEAKLPPDATEKEFRAALNRAYKEATEKLGLKVIPTPGRIEATPEITPGEQAQ